MTLEDIKRIQDIKYKQSPSEMIEQSSKVNEAIEHREKVKSSRKYK